MDERIRAPEGYEVIGTELYQVNASGKKRKIANVTLKVVSRKNVISPKSKEVIRLVGVKFSYGNQEGESVLRYYREEDVLSGKFMKDIPACVIVEPRCGNIAKEIFRWYIQMGMQDLPVDETEYPYGWHDKKFYWGDKVKAMALENEYQTALRSIELLMSGSDAINAMVLAAVHGPLMSLLYDSGVRHNFTTDISGGSGVGKTELTRLVVNGVTGKTASLASGRKALLKTIQDNKDLTFVLDDYNKAESGRTKDRIQQTVSEVIQSQCDSERLIFDEEDNESDGHVHIIISREESFKNLSTINRTYWVHMKEALPLKIYDKMQRFSGDEMLFFIQSLIKFIESDYIGMTVKIKADYELFQTEARNKYANNRVANTIAVQRVLKKVLILYYKYIGCDEEIMRKLDFLLERSINGIGHEICNYIDTVNKKATNMKVLPRLAYIITNIGNGYELASSEEKYCRKVKDGYRHVIGFCACKGYLSFKMEAMISLLNEDGCQCDEPVSGKLLSKELNAYNLAHKDSEGKLSSVWHTEKRMYHVEVLPLLELCDKWEGFETFVTRFMQEHFGY